MFFWDCGNCELYTLPPCDIAVAVLVVVIVAGVALEGTEKIGSP